MPLMLPYATHTPVDGNYLEIDVGKGEEGW